LQHGVFGNPRKPLSIALPAKEIPYKLACLLMSISYGGRLIVQFNEK
jgi:hypothetical protein